jgi:hypothetical protein
VAVAMWNSIAKKIEKKLRDPGAVTIDRFV